MSELIALTKKMGRSPVGGYFVQVVNESIEVSSVHRKDGGLMRQFIRLPKDRDDFMRVFATLLKHTTGGELSAQAIVAEMFN